MKLIKFVISFFYLPLVLPSIFAYYLSSENVKTKLNEDIEFQWKRRYGCNKYNNIHRLYFLLIQAKEFRNVYYCNSSLIFE